MIVDPNTLDAMDSHKILTSIIIPRPIAWVTTLNENGSVNAAPFSFFMGVSTKPPRLAISISAKGGEIKDTAKNIIKNSEFVVNMVTDTNVEAMNSTAGLYDYGVEELKIAGLSTSGSDKIAPPCIKESPVSMECMLEKVVEIGAENHFLIIGEVVLFHIDDGKFENGIVDPQKIHAVGRLEGSSYTHVNNIFEI